MKWTEKQCDRIITRLRGRRCRCGSGSWEVDDSAQQLTEFCGGDVIPLVAMVCNVCGEVHLFSARFLGLIDGKGRLVE